MKYSTSAWSLTLAQQHIQLQEYLHHIKPLCLLGQHGCIHTSQISDCNVTVASWQQCSSSDRPWFNAALDALFVAATTSVSPKLHTTRQQSSDSIFEDADAAADEAAAETAAKAERPATARQGIRQMDEASHAALKYADDTIHAPDCAVLAESGVEVRAVVDILDRRNCVYSMFSSVRAAGVSSVLHQLGFTHPHLVVTLVMTLLTLYRTLGYRVVATDFMPLKSLRSSLHMFKDSLSSHMALSLSRDCITAGRLRPWPQMLTSHAAKQSAELRRRTRSSPVCRHSCKAIRGALLFHTWWSGLQSMWTLHTQPAEYYSLAQSCRNRQLEHATCCVLRSCTVMQEQTA